eukprot:CAMPEP_0184044554 /NCGR_PEP_ID=MMETSP0956-20121227/351_1 /TAXON_ID=627963 /ORGANISM="Aplanochytrium sp, Strain PBS07" /LENGTH=36 /DNA_ID= /DNA_START= /DNA_END= /DNA_ORIENTATION=
MSSKGGSVLVLGSVFLLDLSAKRAGPNTTRYIPALS